MDHKDLCGSTLGLHPQVAELNRNSIRKYGKGKSGTHLKFYLSRNYNDWFTEKTQSWLGDFLWRQPKPTRTQVIQLALLYKTRKLTDYQWVIPPCGTGKAYSSHA